MDLQVLDIIVSAVAPIAGVIVGILVTRGFDQRTRDDERKNASIVRTEERDEAARVRQEERVAAATVRAEERDALATQQAAAEEAERRREDERRDRATVESIKGLLREARKCGSPDSQREIKAVVDDIRERVAVLHDSVLGARLRDVVMWFDHGSEHERSRSRVVWRGSSVGTDLCDTWLRGDAPDTDLLARSGKLHEDAEDAHGLYLDSQPE